jgi:hypothetical protein
MRNTPTVCVVPGQVHAGTLVQSGSADKSKVAVWLFGKTSPRQLTQFATDGRPFRFSVSIFLSKNFIFNIPGFPSFRICFGNQWQNTSTQATGT